ncbi:RegA-like protein RlsG [Volvox carteri f. nagariensis]|uniref:RegA-like protein RlsG n=1 Tax=Volvox carteri f. nagariensis TaxID=3068 RepID=D8U1T5_VOLCA|nr:RegA-like protein RlsG [Volvox carteri f. nagariensis]EFJ46237.1 RegA-like protein RlsG [Volvox carteri f. nagariensis]|eukprot:XP_002952684.1 RegA-like protein RlsG [Volvox carteri f. nagariensis]
MGTHRRGRGPTRGGGARRGAGRQDRGRGSHSRGGRGGRGRRGGRGGGPAAADAAAAEEEQEEEEEEEEEDATEDDVGEPQAQRGRGNGRGGGRRPRFKYTREMRGDLGDRYQEDAHRGRTTGQYRTQMNKFREFLGQLQEDIGKLAEDLVGSELAEVGGQWLQWITERKGGRVVHASILRGANAVECPIRALVEYLYTMYTLAGEEYPDPLKEEDWPAVAEVEKRKVTGCNARLSVPYHLQFLEFAARCAAQDALELANTCPNNLLVLCLQKNPMWQQVYSRYRHALANGLATKRLREMERVRPGPTDAKRLKRASKGGTSTGGTLDDGIDAGEQTERGDSAAAAAAGGPGTPTQGTIYGIFHPDRYLSGEDCIDYQGNFITRSKFEKLGGSLMAKWYRSIRVVTTDEPLGTWLTRRGLPVLKGTSRNRKQVMADMNTSTTSNDKDNGQVATRATGPKAGSGGGGGGGGRNKIAGSLSGTGNPDGGPGKRAAAAAAADGTSGGGRDAATAPVPAASGYGTGSGDDAVPATSQAGSGHGCVFNSRGGADKEATTAATKSGPTGGGGAAAAAPSLQLRLSLGTERPFADQPAAAVTAAAGGVACSGSLLPSATAAAVALSARAADPYMLPSGSPLGGSPSGRAACLPVLTAPNPGVDDARVPPYNAALRGPQRFSPSCSSQVSSDEPLQASFLSYATASEAAIAASVPANASVATGIDMCYQAAAPLPVRFSVPASGSGLSVELPPGVEVGGNGVGHDSGAADSMRSVMAAVAQPTLPPREAATFCFVSGNSLGRAPGQSILGSGGGGVSAPPAPPPGLHTSPEQADAAWLYWAWSGYGDLQEGSGQLRSAPVAAAPQPMVTVVRTAPDTASERLHIRNGAALGAGGGQLPCAQSCGGGSRSIDAAASLHMSTGAVNGAAGSSWPSLLPAPSLARSYGGGTDSCGYGGAGIAATTTTTNGGVSLVSYFGNGGRRSLTHFEHNTPQGAPSKWAAPLLGSSGPSEPSQPSNSRPLNRIEMVKQELLRGTRVGGGATASTGGEVLWNSGAPRGLQSTTLASLPQQPPPPPPSHQLPQPPLVQLRCGVSGSFEARVERLMRGGSSSSGGGCCSGSSMTLDCSGVRVAAAAAAGSAGGGGALLTTSCIGCSSSGGNGDGRVGVEPGADAGAAAALAGRMAHKHPTGCFGQPQQGGPNALQHLPAGGSQQALRLQDCEAAAGGTAALGWCGPLGPGPPHFPGNTAASSWGLCLGGVGCRLPGCWNWSTCRSGFEQKP